MCELFDDGYCRADARILKDLEGVLVMLTRRSRRSRSFVRSFIVCY